MPNIRHLVRIAAIAGTVVMTSFAVRAADLGAEIANARMHAGLAAQGSDIATVHTHLQHTINCLVGPNGAGFDANALNPCANAGGGAIPDETDAAKKMALQSAASKAAAGFGASDLATAQKDASSVATMLTNVK